MVMSVAGCGVQATPPAATSSPTTLPTVPPTPAPSALNELIDALRAAGATVESGGPIQHSFFSVEGQIITVNGADVQVFEYGSPAAAGAEAETISDDGGQIGTTMVTWVDTPHFYQKDNLIVLYVGSDELIAGLLEAALDAPIAVGPAMPAGPGEPVAALTKALDERDWAALQAQMGDQFIIGYWRSEGVTLSPQEAIEQLQTNLVSADATLTYTTDESQFPSLDGILLESTWGPDVNVVQSIFSQGWGQDGEGEAILAVAAQPDGSTYWYGMIYAPAGFD
jgi:hypothetical protein